MTTEQNTSETLTPEQISANARTRKKKLLLTGVVFASVGAAWLAYHLLVGRYHEETDNAYVSGSVVAVNAQTQGTVEAILVEENQEVKAGQTLVKLNATDAQVALNQASAQLAETTRQITQAFNNTSVTQAQLNQAQIALKTAQDAVNRRAPLVATGAVSKEELATARDTLARAQAALQVAATQSKTANAQVADTDVAHHPSVERAKATFRAAFINQKRLSIVAPMDGVIAKRFVQIGQSVTPNLPLMNIIAANQVWIDANFKETQLANLRIGQPVSIRADVYGSAVDFKGKIQGIAMGTGSAFSVIPAQNATGNWIKIVQRVPVRIVLDAPEQLKQAPLRVGMSVAANVDTHQRDLPLIGAMPNEATQAQLSTSVYAQDEQEADAAAMKIIQKNQR
ncbi:MAG: efflux RND transporter periplasmic adaptor subunit [Formosimonas sp.]